MKFVIQSKSGVPIYEQIEVQIKEAIVNKELKEGEPLPSIRSLAADLKISVITTKRAYEDLEKEGMIYSVQGKGFFVDNPDLDYLEEKRTVGIEMDVQALVKKAKDSGLDKQALTDMLEIFWAE